MRQQRTRRPPARAKHTSLGVPLKIESSHEALGGYRKASRGAVARRPIVAGLVAVVAALVAVALLASMCQSASSQQPGASQGAGQGETADRWAGLTWENGFAYYEEDGKPCSQTGVDVSDHQGQIDWSAVAAEGIEFAYVRAGSRGYTEGSLIPDEYCATNLDGAKAAGLETGAYFFSQATTVEEAREEAQMALDQIGGRQLDLPVAFDHETVESPDGRANKVSRSDLTACAKAFCEVIEAAGYSTIIYGNAHDLVRFDLNELGDRPVWLAEYGVPRPTLSIPLALWQYTNEAYISGISTSVDLNIRFTNVL